MNSQPLILLSQSEEQTRAIGRALGRLAAPGDLILLYGDLGSGKTTLTQGIAQGLGIADEVQSPTFTLVQEHDGATVHGEPIRLYHLDLYRLAGEADLDSFGFADYVAPAGGLTVVEWPERAAASLPDSYLLIEIDVESADRRLTLRPVPPDGPYAAWLPHLQPPPTSP